MIKIIDSLCLTANGPCVYNRGYQPILKTQGNLDGACLAYSCMMVLEILNIVSERQLRDLENRVPKSPQIEKLFNEFFVKRGLIREGLFLSDVGKKVENIFKNKLRSTYLSISEKLSPNNLIEEIKNTLDNNLPVILGINYQTGGGHAVVAIGYEFDQEGMYNIFCLDPGFGRNRTSYWNMVISLDIYRRNKIYKHEYFSNDPDYHHAISIQDILIIEKV
ncbi:MAG: C39 family peptidase [Muribaculaceae bacterium]|nr:C39 family peptidase [Muribaculaceae bacterium]